MPRKSRRTKINFGKRSSRRRSATPNTYIAPAIDENGALDGEAVSNGTAVAPEAAERASRRRARATARAGRGRRGRQAPMRAAVYGEFLPAELRKLGALTAVLVLVLAILTITIG